MKRLEQHESRKLGKVLMGMNTESGTSYTECEGVSVSLYEGCVGLVFWEV